MVEPFLLFISLMGCFAIYRWGRSLQRLMEPKPLEMNEETSADDIIERYRQSRTERRSKEKAAWDEWYLKSLPVEEHPDYFEVDPDTDEVECIMVKTMSGEVLNRWETRTNSRGIPYTITPDYVTGTALISTQRISWEVPISALGRKYNQPERKDTIR